jgi:hypothetical protein
MGSIVAVQSCPCSPSAQNAVDRSNARLLVAYTDQRSGASNVWVTHAAKGGSISSFTAPSRVKASSDEDGYAVVEPDPRQPLQAGTPDMAHNISDSPPASRASK